MEDRKAQIAEIEQLHRVYLDLKENTPDMKRDGEIVRRACGAHVEIIAESKLYYIAPMCNDCNLEGRKVVIKGGTKIVPEIAPIIK